MIVFFVPKNFYSTSTQNKSIHTKKLILSISDTLNTEIFLLIHFLNSFKMSIYVTWTENKPKAAINIIQKSKEIV